MLLAYLVFRLQPPTPAGHVLGGLAGPGQLAKKGSRLYRPGAPHGRRGDFFAVGVFPSLVRREIQHAVLDAHQIPLGPGRLGGVELGLGDGVEADLVKDSEHELLVVLVLLRGALRGTHGSARIPDVVDGSSYKLIAARGFGRINLES